MLKVTVHGEDELALCVIETCGESGGLAEVASQLNDEDTRINRGDLFQQAIGAVARTIIDEDQFEGLAYVLHDSLQAVVERGDVVFFVVERNDD